MTTTTFLQKYPPVILQRSMCDVQCSMHCSGSLGARSSTRSSPRTVTLGRIEFSSEQMRSVFSEMLFVKSRNTGSAVQCDIKCTKLSVHDVLDVYTMCQCVQCAHCARVRCVVHYCAIGVHVV